MQSCFIPSDHVIGAQRTGKKIYIIIQTCKLYVICIFKRKCFTESEHKSRRTETASHFKIKFFKVFFLWVDICSMYLINLRMLYIQIFFFTHILKTCSYNLCTQKKKRHEEMFAYCWENYLIFKLTLTSFAAPSDLQTENALNIESL